jgi:hypothetical protein
MIGGTSSPIAFADFKLMTSSKLRIRAEGNQIRGWLNDQQLIDRQDQRYKSGRIGLWTKADSVTAFSDFVVQVLGRQ